MNILNQITPWLIDHGIKILIILIVAFVFHKISKRFIVKLVERIITAEEGGDGAEEKREKTLIGILHGALHAVVVLVTVLMTLSEVGMDIGPLIAGAGVIGLAFGFGAQYLIRDIITGLFIILENQYRVGDSIEIAGLSGGVEDISLRITTLRDLDGVVHHVPHGEITTVSNKSKGISKVNLDLGVSYDADLNKSRDLINKVGKELSEDEYFGELITEAPKFLRVQELADSAVILKITGVTKPGKQFEVTGELRKRLKESCDKEGIEIPYPQLTVHQLKK